MGRSARIVWGTVAILALYMVVVVYNGPRNSTEIFPFFNWDLFSRVPQAKQENYDIRLVEVNGKRLARPVYFEQASSYISTSKSSQAYAVMQELGKRTEASDVAQADSIRTILETRFFQELDTATYELVRRRYDILDRVKCHCVLGEVVIGEFTLR